MAEERPARRAPRSAEAYRLEIPLDASTVGELAPDERQDLKVVVRDASSATHSVEISLGKDLQGTASFDFAEAPGPLEVFVGPAAATDEEMVQSQTISISVGARLWGDRRDLRLAPVAVTPYWWFWWLRWCREFVIRGRVVCPDGSPVPGAEVCASDVDWWLWWSSTQQVGCATTDVNGAFEIRFRWCCGWWPWWWWRHRIWQLDEILVERVGAVLATRPDIELGRISSQPSLAAFEGLLREEGVVATRPLEAADASLLETLRERLVATVPGSEELTRLHVWPWWPWQPWWDCTPDVIFRVTQQCQGAAATTIVAETVWDTRWNISSPLQVTLVAGEDACCRPVCPDPPCEEGECLVVDRVCGIPLTSVGGNLGAPPVPVGYAYPAAVAPGSVGYNGDRPFSGSITVWKNPGDLIGLDYLELETFDVTSSSWISLPMGAELGFNRQYWEPGVGMGFPAFPVQMLSGHRVWATREHYEAVSGVVWFPSGGWSRVWLSLNYSLLAHLDSSKFPDGTYQFRAVGWNDGGGGTLINRRVIPICGTDEENRFVLTFDNRVITAVGHDPAHNCGGVHMCTVEPDTHILDVRIGGASVEPCGVVKAEGDLEIDFSVTDPEGHLAVYSLIATWGLNNSVNLMPLGTIFPLGPGVVPGPTYGQALAQAPGSAPYWYGGSYRLTIPNASAAFAEPCCYQLELRAWKRSIVDCWGGYGHHNLTEYSLGIGIC